jgi:toxin ParE1/3/4
VTGGKVEKGGRVRRDLFLIYTQIGRSSPKSADRFLIAAEKTFSQLAGRPGMGEPYESENPALAPIRRSLISARFRNYLVYYAPIDGGIRVLRVVHAAREPEDLLEADDFD